MKKFMLMTPEKMQLICNIQGMEKSINNNRLCTTYQEMQNMTIQELREKQDQLIPEYNKRSITPKIED